MKETSETNFESISIQRIVGEVPQEIRPESNEANSVKGFIPKHIQLLRDIRNDLDQIKGYLVNCCRETETLCDQNKKDK